MFYVAEAYQRRGVGRRLLEAVLAGRTGGTVTVDAPTKAEPAFRHLGFRAIDQQRVEKGVSILPMAYQC